MGIIMLEFANLKSINEQYGRAEGNRMLRRFSDVLRESAAGSCFVGRNGGLRFLALFEHGSDERMKAFIDSVSEQIDRINAEPDTPRIVYTWGRAFR